MSSKTSLRMFPVDNEEKNTGKPCKIWSVISDWSKDLKA